MMAYEKISLRINHCLELLDDDEGVATKLFDVQKNLSAIEEDPEISNCLISLTICIFKSKIKQNY